MITWLKKFFKFSNVIIISVIAMNLWFTIRVLDAFIITGNEPMALVGAFFAFTTGELLTLSSIKKAKIKRDTKIEVNPTENYKGE